MSASFRRRRRRPQHSWAWHREARRKDREYKRRARLRPDIRRGRERAFVDAFVLLALCASEELARGGADVQRTSERLLAGLGLVHSAAWKSARMKDGAPMKGTMKKGMALLALPRIQNAIAERLSESGLSIDLVAERHRQLVMQMENPEVALRGVELYYKLVTGFAATKSANLQVHTRQDGFFTPELPAPPPQLD